MHPIIVKLQRHYTTPTATCCIKQIHQ